MNGEPFGQFLYDLFQGASVSSLGTGLGDAIGNAADAGSSAAQSVQDGIIATGDAVVSVIPSVPDSDTLIMWAVVGGVLLVLVLLVLGKIEAL